MSLYLDSSALLKRYVEEHDSASFNALIESGESWITSRVTWIEVWRNLGRRLSGQDSQQARAAFKADWQRFAVVEVDATVCSQAATLADMTGSRTLDAIHLAAMHRAGPDGISLITADLKQAQAARSLGWIVLGA